MSLKIVTPRLTRRALLQRLGIAAAAWPLARMSRTLAAVDRRHRRERSLTYDNIWIGHC